MVFMARSTGGDEVFEAEEETANHLGGVIQGCPDARQHVGLPETRGAAHHGVQEEHVLALQPGDGALQQLEQGVRAATRPRDDDAPADSCLVGNLEECFPQGEPCDVHLLDRLHRHVDGIDDGLDVRLGGAQVDLLLHPGVSHEEEGALLQVDDRRGDPAHLQLLSELPGDPCWVCPLEAGGGFCLLRTHAS